MAKKEKKDPWGAAAPNPFTSTHNEVTASGADGIDWGPILDGTNRRRNMEKGMREGFVMAEDGSMVPRSYYGLPPKNGGGRMVQAEDGSWVPETFYTNSRDPYYRNQAPIEW